MVVDFDALNAAIEVAKPDSSAKEIRRGIILSIDKAKSLGLSYHKMSDILNSQGITTATGRKWNRGMVQKFWQNNKELMNEE